MIRRILLALAMMSVAPAAGAHVLLDPAFGDGGVASLPVASSIGYSLGIAVQSDHRVLVVASKYTEDPNDTTALCIARSTASGAPDPSYGDGGAICHALGLAPGDIRQFFPEEVRLLPDGRLLVVALLAMEYGGPGAKSVLVARLNSDGSLDPSFNIVGYRWLPYVANAAIRLVPAPGSRWLLAMLSPSFPFSQSPGAISIWRLHEDGSLDPTFGDGGQVAASTQQDSPSDIIVLPDGRFQILLRLNATAIAVAAWRRFGEDGQLDPDYGSGGTHYILPRERWFGRVNPLPDAGYLAFGTKIWRLDAMGAFVESFASGSGLTVGNGLRSFFPFRDGRLLAVRSYQTGFFPGPTEGFYLNLYDGSGVQDMTFADDGEFFVRAYWPDAVDVDAPSKIVIARSQASIVELRRYWDARPLGSSVAAVLVPGPAIAALAVLALSIVALAARQTRGRRR